MTSERPGTSNQAQGIETELPQGAVVYSSIVAFLAWVVCVYDFIMFGTLLPKIAEDFGWATATSTAIATLVSIGTMVVALGVGPLIDYLGRKRALIVTTAGTGLSSLLTGLTPAAIAAPYLTLVRAISGLGYSEQAVNTAYLNEIYGTRKNRGFIYAFIQGGWPIGVLLASAFTALLLEPVGWRGVFMLATIPALIVAILGLKLRETPRFLAMQRIRQLERENRHDEAIELGRRFDIDVHHVRQSTLRQIFEPDIRKHTIFLALAFLTNWIGIQVFAVLGTTVLTEGKGVSFGSALTVLIVSNAAAYIGYLCHGFVGDRIGRRLTIAGGWIIAGAAYTIMLFGPNAESFVLTMYTIGLFFIIGPYAALLFFMGESFPTRVRGTGASFVNAMGPIGAIVGSALLTWFLTISGNNMVLSAFLSGGLATLLSGVLMLGTRDVKDPTQAEVLPEDEGSAEAQAT
ncbi:major facilitator superfamily MFS_1 [Rubrobacter xylanophilus DSM 9941]|uniref:Major facilitator superfamily MFS_1 n=1 Tax=Rubrobacter xylanophilus (strain DSM 9941 / JCM 11954 / NBRC 16129 / PRD-1) TaxID=266117 RepID=Q1ASH4_RUBXD|nr:MFS transporter [Rubrobacter xylanophilus]ABG05654.1 major facilitator superfamily MFS_1 [Rubrobacter xylanophilus DSM 9941]